MRARCCPLLSALQVLIIGGGYSPGAWPPITNHQRPTTNKPGPIIRGHSSNCKANPQTEVCPHSPVLVSQIRTTDLQHASNSNPLPVQPSPAFRFQLSAFYFPLSAFHLPNDPKGIPQRCGLLLSAGCSIKKPAISQRVFLFSNFCF